MTQTTDTAPVENMQRPHRTEPVVFACLVAAHMVLGILIAWPIGRVRVPHLLLLTASVPWAQASLLALWAATSHARSYARFLLLMLGLLWVGFVESRSLGLGIQEDVAAAHAMMLITQAAIVFTVAWPTRIVASMRRAAAETTSSPRQIRLASLMAWVGAIAVVLSVARVVWGRSGWTYQVVQGQYFLFACVLGVYHASYALLVAGAVLVGRRWVAIRLVVALVLIGLIAFSTRHVLEALFQEDGDLSTGQWMAQAGFQVTLMLATLLPLRIVRWRQRASAPPCSLAECSTSG